MMLAALSKSAIVYKLRHNGILTLDCTQDRWMKTLFRLANGAGHD